MNRHNNWIYEYLEDNWELREQFNKSNELRKENSFGHTLKKAQEAYNKLLLGYETKETKRIYNKETKEYENCVETTRQIGPSEKVVMETLKATTTRFASINPIATRQILLEFFTFLANQNINIESLIPMVQTFLSIQDSKSNI